MGSQGKAKFDLLKVQKLAENIEGHMFTKSKATDPVVFHLKITLVEAQCFILSEICKLTEDNFSRSVLLNGYVYDVYGKRICDIPWYIKFSIFKDDVSEFIFCISFHPTEHDLETQSEILERYCP